MSLFLSDYFYPKPAIRGVQRDVFMTLEAKLLLFISDKHLSTRGSRQGAGAVCQLATLFGFPPVSPCPATTFVHSAAR